MRALHIVELTGPNGIKVVDIPTPSAGDDILVEVHAIGVRYPDLLRAQGLYQERTEPPYVPFDEFAGVVLWAPSGSTFAAGDRVCGTTRGAAAEQVVVRAEQLFALPRELTYEQGAGLILNYETAILGLEVRGRLTQGEHVLIHGAGGGTGTAAIQVAKANGSTVIALVSSAEKERIARQAGADTVVRDGGPWKDQTLELTNGNGVDVVWDPVGGERWLDTLRVLAVGGRWVVIGFAGGSIPSVPLNRVLLRNVDVVGAFYSGYLKTRPDLAAHLRRRLASFVAAGVIRPVIGPTYTFEDASAALSDLAARRAVGKVVITT